MKKAKNSAAASGVKQTQTGLQRMMTGIATLASKIGRTKTIKDSAKYTRGGLRKHPLHRYHFGQFTPRRPFNLPGYLVRP